MASLEIDQPRQHTQLGAMGVAGPKTKNPSAMAGLKNWFSILRVDQYQHTQDRHDGLNNGGSADHCQQSKQLCSLIKQNTFITQNLPRIYQSLTDQLIQRGVDILPPFATCAFWPCIQIPSVHIVETIL